MNKEICIQNNITNEINIDNDQISEFNKSETTQDNESLNIINENQLNITENNLLKTESKEETTNKNEIKKSIKKVKMKSSLKGSKEAIKYIKKQILEIFDENKISEKLEYLKNSYNPIINIEDLYPLQEIYEKNLDNLFNNKMKKIDEINEKFDPDLNELNYFIEEEKKKEKENTNIPEEENSPSATKIIYNEILGDKKTSLEAIEKEYIQNFENIKKEYIVNIESIKNDKLSKELFQNIKDDIFKIIKPKNPKKVNFE